MHRFFALLGPAVVAVLGSWLLLWPEPSGPLTGEPAEIAALLADDPKVVVIGNSLVQRGVDADALALSLGLPEGEVAKVFVWNSRMPHWYAVIKERILEAGHRPTLIVVGTSPRWTLDNAMPDERTRARLDEHLSRHDPAVARVLGEPESALLSRARTRRVQLRETMLSAIRRNTLHSLGFDDRRHDQLDELFSTGNTDRRPDRVIPVAQPTAAPDAAPQPLNIDDNLIAEITAMCQEANVNIVFTWIPTAPRSRTSP